MGFPWRAWSRSKKCYAKRYLIVRSARLQLLMYESLSSYVFNEFLTSFLRQSSYQPIWRSDTRKILRECPLKSNCHESSRDVEMRADIAEIVPFFELCGNLDTGLLFSSWKDITCSFQLHPLKLIWQWKKNTAYLKMYLSFKMLIVHVAMLLRNKGICYMFQWLFGFCLLKGQENLILQMFQLRKKHKKHKTSSSVLSFTEIN